MKNVVTFSTARFAFVALVALFLPFSVTFAAHTPIVNDPNQVGPSSFDSSGRAVYRQANSDAYGSVIRLFNPVTDERHVIASGKWYTDPILRSNRVVWFESSSLCETTIFHLCTPANGRWDLVTYNIATQHRQVIAQDLGTTVAPTVTENIVVWEKQGANGTEVFSFDFSTGVTLHLIPSNGITTTPTSTSTGGSTGGTALTTAELVAVAPDTDGDEIPDTSERVLFFTSPVMFDTDTDGLSDYEELYFYKTSPTVIDTDRDGWLDSREISDQTNASQAGREFFSRSYYEWTGTPIPFFTP